MAVLQVQNIEKHFGKVQVLQDISFDLEEGQTLAIIGSSGSGKTTLFALPEFSGSTGRWENFGPWGNAV